MPKTMADLAMAVGPVTPAQLKGWFADLRKVAKVGQTLSRWFPGRVPPGPVNAAADLLDMVEPYLDDPELASAINFVLELFRPDPDKLRQNVADEKPQATVGVPDSTFDAACIFKQEVGRRI